MDQLTLLAWRIPRTDARGVEQATLPVPPEGLAPTLQRARHALDARGLAYLATCQRVAWVLHGAPADAEARLRDLYAGLGRPALAPLELWEGAAAFRHLAEVASSLDSLVAGEPQVLGQVRQAARACDEAGVLGPHLRRTVGLALRCAKAVRSRTRLFEGKVSLVPLAEGAMRQALAHAEAPAAVVVGTGRIGRKALAKVRQVRPDARLHVVSRDSQRALQAAEREGAEAHTLDAFLANPPQACLVVLAMDADKPLLSASWLADAVARHGPATVLDLALPRNAEPPASPVPGLRLVQLDDLATVSAQARDGRDAAYADAVAVLETELERVGREHGHRHHAATLRELAERFQSVSEARWRQAPGLDPANPHARKWYEQTVRALLHEATAALKAPGRP